MSPSALEVQQIEYAPQVQKTDILELTDPPSGRYNRKDLTGRRYGRLLVEYPTDRRDYKGSVIWHCRCDCGNEVEVSYDRLTYGNYVSCGCKKKEHQDTIFQTLHVKDDTCAEWLENRKHRSDNTSGLRGVTLRKNGTYSVNIGFKRKRYYVGTYPTYEEAVLVREQVEEVVHNGYLRARKRWDACPHLGQKLIYEIHKGERYLEIVSNDEQENGKIFEF